VVPVEVAVVVAAVVMKLKTSRRWRRRYYPRSSMKRWREHTKNQRWPRGQIVALGDGVDDA
jgi:hypothetical protein